MSPARRRCPLLAWLLVPCFAIALAAQRPAAGSDPAATPAAAPTATPTPTLAPATAAATATTPATPSPRRPFARYVAAPEGGRLELLLADYRKDDAALTLFAAVHVAEPEYYADLQRRFAACDVLLYEMVGDPSPPPHPAMARDRSEPLTLAYTLLARGLRLGEQFDHVDYRGPRFVHADFTERELEAEYARAGGSVLGDLLASAWILGDDDVAPTPRIDVVAAVRDGRGAHAVRELLAHVLARPVPARHRRTVLIEGRNERCLEVLHRQLLAGHRRVGIFYGAAHMEHLERRLLHDLGWQRTGEHWVTAWDNRRDRFPPEPPGTQRLLRRARAELAAHTATLQAWLRTHPGREPGWDTLRSTAPRIDPWGRPYELQLAGEAFVVRSRGADGAAGTADDVAGAKAPIAVGLAELLQARQRRARELEQSLERLRGAPAREAAAFARQQVALRAERAEVAAAGGPLVSAFAAVEHANARMRALSLLVVAEEYRRRERAVPTLAGLALHWLAGEGLDPWGAPFRIVESQPGVLVVRSDGPDGKPDTADDVVVGGGQ